MKWSSEAIGERLGRRLAARTPDGVGTDGGIGITNASVFEEVGDWVRDEFRNLAADRPMPTALAIAAALIVLVTAGRVVKNIKVR